MNISAKPATLSRIHLRARRIILSLACAAGAFAIPAVAQQQGPLPPPPAGSSSGSPGMGSSGSAVPVEGGMAHSESAITSEPPAIPAVAALANALARATGVRLREVPIDRSALVSARR